MPPLELAPLAAEHVPAAAELAAARYRDLVAEVPWLPATPGDPAALLPRLTDMAARGSGAVALRGGRLVGLLAAYLLEGFRGRRAAFSPEWANAAEAAESRAVLAALYGHLAGGWAAGGYGLHWVSTLPHDRAALEGWHWLSFGMATVDGVRGLDEVAARPAGLALRRADPADLRAMVELEAGLYRHLAAGPIFLPLPPGPDLAELAAELADPAYAFWLAEGPGGPVAYMKFGPASGDGSTVVRDAGTASITGAFTVPAARGQGAAAALLGRGLAWAREAGYARCAVDFEPMNAPAARFWMAHFRPVCYGLIRRIDERVVP